MAARTPTPIRQAPPSELACSQDRKVGGQEPSYEAPEEPTATVKFFLSKKNLDFEGQVYHDVF